MKTAREYGYILAGGGGGMHPPYPPPWIHPCSGVKMTESSEKTPNSFCNIVRLFENMHSSE